MVIVGSRTQICHYLVYSSSTSLIYTVSMILVGVLDDKIQQTPVMADDEGAPLRMLYCKTIYRHPRLMKSKNAKRCRSDLTTIQRLLTKHRMVMLVQKSQREKRDPSVKYQFVVLYW